MSQNLLNDLMIQAQDLSPEEKLKLIGFLSENITRNYDFSEKKRSNWRKVRGILPEPIVGEDAQEWVSHNRQGATEYREKVV
jgi:hypothetical protein